MTVLRLQYLVITCAVAAVACAHESLTVPTAQGPVTGYKVDDLFVFYGIPYATAPTGPNRFKAPLPGPVWMQPLEAINDKILCPQVKVPMFNFSSYSMQEDCLVANVQIPDTKETNLPVLVFVHGGGYQAGWSAMTTPKTLVKTKKIISVSFNYRLGTHGFLCLGTEGAPGNAGMKDQVALLRWVKKNIANFGGNPDDVTIVGTSAGASAVDLLMLSDMTKGLYNKVIPESGSALGVFSIQNNPMKIAQDFAKANNFTNVDDIKALEDFYTSASYDVLISDLFLSNTDSTFTFVPCVERNVGVETFLEDSPLNILKQGKYIKVPVLNGFANMEGLFRIPNFDQWKDKMNERFADFLPADLRFGSEEERDHIAQKIKEFYFGDKPVSEETVQGYIDYFSDIFFTYSHLKSVQLQVTAGSDSIFLYEYSFYSPPPAALGLPEYITKIKGANHCAQTMAVHDLMPGLLEEDKSEEYLKLRATLREMWLNFITTGKPVPEGSSLPAWLPVGTNLSPYMDLGEEIKLIKGPLLEKRFRFWDEIYTKFYRMPVPPKNLRRKDEL